MEKHRLNREDEIVMGLLGEYNTEKTLISFIKEEFKKPTLMYANIIYKTDIVASYEEAFNALSEKATDQKFGREPMKKIPLLLMETLSFPDKSANFEADWLKCNNESYEVFINQLLIDIIGKKYEKINMKNTPPGDFIIRALWAMNRKNCENYALKKFTGQIQKEEVAVSFWECCKGLQQNILNKKFELQKTRINGKAHLKTKITTYLCKVLVNKVYDKVSENKPKIKERNILKRNLKLLFYQFCEIHYGCLQNEETFKDKQATISTAFEAAFKELLNKIKTEEASTMDYYDWVIYFLEVGSKHLESPLTKSNFENVIQQLNETLEKEKKGKSLADYGKMITNYFSPILLLLTEYNENKPKKIDMLKSDNPKEDKLSWKERRFIKRDRGTTFSFY